MQQHPIFRPVWSQEPLRSILQHSALLSQLQVLVHVLLFFSFFSCLPGIEHSLKPPPLSFWMGEVFTFASLWRPLDLDIVTGPGGDGESKIAFFYFNFAKLYRITQHRGGCQAVSLAVSLADPDEWKWLAEFNQWFRPTYQHCWRHLFQTRCMKHLFRLKVPYYAIFT